jgi:ABC-2 type transport system permease protein
MNLMSKVSKKPSVRLILWIAIIIAITCLLSVFHYRFDLTAEKRYTLSDYTKSTLRSLQADIKVKIYLDGELNIPFYKMQQRLRETMEEFHVYSRNRLQYEFINPFKGESSTETDNLLNELVEKGLKPTNIYDRDKEGGSTEKLVVPGALVQSGEVEIPVNLLKNNPGISAEENINSSLEGFEYEFMRVISSLLADTTEKIAFIEGHGEFDEYHVGDITRELGWNYQVDRGRIDGKYGSLDQYKAVIIAGPTQPFNEQDKFVLDQYLLHGGKVLWFVDMVNASMDSISGGNAFLAMIRMLNIDDILFRYGVRINPLLVQDIQCITIPVNVALAGNAPDFRPAPWLYSPLLTASQNNTVTRNLNLIKSDFTGSIDLIEAREGIKKTVLLATSRYSREVSAPLVISLDEVRLTPREEEFRMSFIPVAALLEGKFESAFKNRIISGLIADTVYYLDSIGQPSSILVVADADIIRNDIRPTPQGVLITPLGYDRYTSQTYGNKEFIVNVIQYMTGHTGLIGLRSREITLRLLDKTKIGHNRSKWVMINTIFPLLMVILAGFIYNWFRRRKFTAR